MLAATALHELESFDSAAKAKKNIRSAIEQVASRLGNTPTICRKCYVLLNSYLEGDVLQQMKTSAESELRDNIDGLSPEEAAVLATLRSRLSGKSQNGAA